LADGARASDWLADKTGSHARALYRLLRALAAAGIFREGEGATFELTSLGACLRSDAPEPVAPWAELIGRPNYWRAWGELAHSVRTGENAFRHANGSEVWAYRSCHAEEGQRFDAAMTALSHQVSEAITAAYDFRSFQRLVDVGGGRGGLLAAVLKKNPALTAVLFDQPHVVAEAGPVLAAAGVGQRCAIVGGSFFEKVPGGCDGYLLKAIIHDWDDDDAERILGACRSAMPPSAKLLLIEQILAGPNKGLVAKMSDLNMLVSPGGRERTREEFASLLLRTGFRMTSLTATKTPLSIIESVPV
jgi:hypothetical protein